MIRLVPGIPAPTPNRPHKSINNNYFDLANETPNDYLMIPCISSNSARLLSKSLRRLNKAYHNLEYEVFKREEVVYLRKKRIDA